MYKQTYTHKYTRTHMQTNTRSYLFLYGTNQDDYLKGQKKELGNDIHTHKVG